MFVHVTTYCAHWSLHLAKVQMDEPFEKIRSLYQEFCWSGKLKPAKTVRSVSYTDSSHPCDHHVFWVDVIGRVQGTCCGKCSGDHHVFWVDVMGRVQGTCCGKCSECILWDVFRAYLVKRVVGSCFGLCSGPMFWDVFGAHVLGKALGFYSEMYLGVM